MLAHVHEDVHTDLEARHTHVPQYMHRGACHTRIVCAHRYGPMGIPHTHTCVHTQRDRTSTLSPPLTGKLTTGSFLGIRFLGGCNETPNISTHRKSSKQGVVPSSCFVIAMLPGAGRQVSHPSDS